MLSGNENLIDRHRRVLPSWVRPHYEEPLELVSGEGCWVYDSDGKKYLDFFGGILTISIGHNVREITERVLEQLRRVAHSSTAYLIRNQVDLAERIAEASGIPSAKVFFVSSGSEANDTALMLASCYRRSNQFLAFAGSYHGRTMADLAVTGISSWSPANFSGLNVAFVPPGDRVGDRSVGVPDDSYRLLLMSRARQVLDTAVNGDIAALIAEPILGVGGFVVPPQGYLAELAAMVRSLGGLVIADEVQTAWGRTGLGMFASVAEGMSPDIITFAKGLANGLPIGGLVARPEVMESLGRLSISTFGGNPLVAAAAMATLDYIEAHDLQSNAKAMGEVLLEGLRNELGGHPLVAEVRGRGLMVGLEVVEADGRPAPEAAASIMEEARQRGLLVGRGGVHANTIRLAPPLAISEAEIRAGLERLLDAVEAALGSPKEPRT